MAPEDRDRLKRIVDAVGEGRAVALVGLPRATLGRVLADLPVRAGTRLALKQSLNDLDRANG